MNSPEDELRLAELEADILRTRERLERELTALGSKLRPDAYKDQVQGALRSAQEAVMENVNEMTHKVADRSKEAGSSLVELVRQHPLPAALIGAGIALLAAGGGVGVRERHRDDEDGHESYGGRYGYGEGEYKGYARPAYSREAPARTGYGEGQAFESYGAYDSGYDTGGYAREAHNQEGYEAATSPTPQPAAGSHEDSWAKENTGGLRERVQEAGERVGYTAQRAKGGFASFLEDQPLVAGLITVVLGALIGLAFPSTRRENELLGGARDHLADQAKGAAERARQVAQKTFEEVRETAKEEFSKLGAEAKEDGKDLLEQGKEAVKHVSDSAKETAKKASEKSN